MKMKMPKVRSLGLHTNGQSPKDVASKRAQVATLLGSYGARSSASRAHFGSSKMLDPNFRREAELCFHHNIQNLKESRRRLQVDYFNIIFFMPKASPLDIVWSRKMTLLLSTWAQYEPASLLGQVARDTHLRTRCVPPVASLQFPP